MSLVKITQEIRLLVKIAAGITVIGVLIFIFIQGGAFIKNVLYPTPPAPPEQKFGKLPNLQFSSPTKELEYRINTVSGSLPTFPDRMLVYTISQPVANILALQNVRSHMTQAGFVDNESRVPEKDTYYQWTNSSIHSTIIYDLLSNNFLMQSSYLTAQDLFSDSILPDTDSITDTLKYFLGAIGADTSDIDFGKTSIKLFTIDNQSLVEATDHISKTQAKVAKLVLFQNSIKVNPFPFGDGTIDSLPVSYYDPTLSNIMFTIAATKSGPQVVEGQFYHFPVNLTQSSTYPLKTAQQAFQDLQKGNAKVFYTGSLANIDITDMNIVFYLSENNPQYLQPIYIFTGKDFIGYVQAISSSSLK
jgi:hypothetical protein